ncbi:MAG: purine-nucleoside phosphorylase [Desulfovibrio sp.]|nr:purine-nucleoside phosphorylase [Desulfovibrio sp.]
MQNFEAVRRCKDVLAQRLGITEPIRFGLLLGTEFLSIVPMIADTICAQIPYADLPSFPISPRSEHAGAFTLARVQESLVLFAEGRTHLYEGVGADAVCMGVRLLGEMGVQTLLLANAAGALNPLFCEGTLMLVVDQINLTGTSPLIGPNYEEYGCRFPDMSQAFDRVLAEKIQAIARAEQIILEKGVYVGVHGPELETPAETRLYRMLGADAIGMSSVLEVICARHLGMRVAAISCLSNKNLPDCMEAIGVEDVLAVCAKTQEPLARLLRGLLLDCALEGSPRLTHFTV